MIDLATYGDPTGCRQASTDASAAARGLSTTISNLGSVKSASASAWTGGAADAFTSKISAVRSDVDELERRVTRVGAALEALAGELTAVRNQMADARERAAGAGLAVAGDQIQPPTGPGGDVTDVQRAAQDDKVTAYNEAQAIAEGAREREDAAHTRLAGELESAAGDGWLEELLEKLGFMPPDGLGGGGQALWALGLGGMGFGFAADWMIKGRYGVFQPRLTGRFGSTAGMGFWERARAATSSGSWHATPYNAGTRARWATAGKVAKYGGVAVSFATAGFSQWQEDADDPSLSTSERAGRAGTVGATTAAGAWAGAEAGAWAGGAIGTAICPGAGTVIGGAIGGVVGGFAGSELGGYVGDHVKDAGGEVTEAVTDFVGDSAGAVGDVASDAGDAITFWD
ncbi:MAG: WXG100 family type VII secretion target [Actinomycetes bacterium]